MFAMMATAIFPVSSLSAFLRGIMSTHTVSDRTRLFACSHQVFCEPSLTIYNTELKIPLSVSNADLADETNHPS